MTGALEQYKELALLLINFLEYLLISSQRRGWEDNLKTCGCVLERVWTVLTPVSNEITHKISQKQARFNDADRDCLAQKPAELDGKAVFGNSLRLARDYCAICR